MRMHNIRDLDVFLMRKVINYIFEARWHTSSGRSLNCRLLLDFKWGKIKMVWNAWTSPPCVKSSSCFIPTTNLVEDSLWPFATCGSYKDTFAVSALDVKSTFYAYLNFYAPTCNIDISLRDMEFAAYYVGLLWDSVLV